MLLQFCSLPGILGCNGLVQDSLCEDVQNVDDHMSSLTAGSVAKAKLKVDVKYMYIECVSASISFMGC